MVSFKGSSILLFSVACSCFSDRSWSFVVPVVLSRTCKQSTFFSSIYSFSELLFVVVVTPLIAPKLSAIRRITVYRTSIILQNVLTAIACFVLAFLVQLFITSSEDLAGDERVYDSRRDWRFIALFIGLCIAGSLSAVFSTFAKVLLSKDMLLHAVRKEVETEIIASNVPLTYDDDDNGNGDGEKDEEGNVPMNEIVSNDTPNSIIKSSDSHSENDNNSESPIDNDSNVMDNNNNEDNDDSKKLLSDVSSSSSDEIEVDGKRSLYDSCEFKLAYDVSLAKANRMFSLIDLSMAVCAPILIGLMCDDVFWKDYTSSDSSADTSSEFMGLDTSKLRLLRNTMYAALFVGIWNVLSCIPETLLPSYAKRKFSLDALDEPQTKTHKKKIVDFGAFKSLFKQPTLLALFSFAMLYVSILTPNSSPLVSYLVGYRGFSSLYISLFAAASQVLGMLGLQVPPPLVKRRWRSTSIQLLGLFLQIIFITLSIVCFGVDYAQYYNDENVSPFSASSVSESSVGSGVGNGFGLIYCALTGIAASRFGLWLADNAFNLMLQKTVPEKDIANVNSALQSLYSMWSSVSLIISIFTPVSMFIVVTASSYGIVFISFVMFFVYWFKDTKRK